MNGVALKAYHHLPYPLRVVGATVRGAQLNRWRYGPETESLVARALERENWSREKWDRWQQDELARVLHRAATRVPYYREQWATRRAHGDHSSVEHLENWPILSRTAIRRYPDAFLADDVDRRHLLAGHTSGTTGASLTLWAGKQSMHRYWALIRARRLVWNRVWPQPWAMLGGQIVVPVAQRKPPLWVWNASSRQLYLSSYHLSPESVPHYAEAMRRHKVRYVIGYASSMHSLASLAAQEGIALPRLTVAISNAETLFDHQRRVIEAGFECPVRNTYGMGEMVCGASECEHGALHLWPEVGVVEVLDPVEPQPLPAGRVGRLVCTGLVNTDMMLVRYEVGDAGALAPAAQGCACGRAMPVLASVEGRLDDAVITPDGRRVGRLDPVFKADLHVHEAQIIQDRLEVVRIRFVPAAGYSDADGQRLVREIRQRVGAMDVALEPVERIERGPNGKFRAVMSHVKDPFQRQSGAPAGGN